MIYINILLHPLYYYIYYIITVLHNISLYYTFILLHTHRSQSIVNCDEYDISIHQIFGSIILAAIILESATMEPKQHWQKNLVFCHV